MCSSSWNPGFRFACWIPGRQLAPLLIELPLDAVLLDLDTQGIAPAAAIDLLAKLRGMNQDLPLMALTRSPDHDLRLKAAKVPVDDFLSRRWTFANCKSCSTATWKSAPWRSRTGA